MKSIANIDDNDDPLASFMADLGEERQHAIDNDVSVNGFDSPLPASSVVRALPEPEKSAAISPDTTLAGIAAAAQVADADGLDDMIDDDDDGSGPDQEGEINPLDENPYFRCLGHLSTSNYFLSLRSGEIFSITPSNMKTAIFLHLAPKEFWQRAFPNQARTGVAWEDAINAMIKSTFRVGTWDPKSEVGLGARMDQGRVVFNSGDMLYVSGVGRIPMRDFRGEFNYTSALGLRPPEVENPFPANAPEIRELLKIINQLNFRQDRRSLSVMALFGWIAISPISGILRWRPHLWIDGQRSSGKSWIIKHIIGRALGQYALLVKSNSTESAIRNMLHAKTLPLVFDEAESEDGKDKVRMDDIIKLARHAASDDDSDVAQGVPGGGGQRFYNVTSMFLLSSITPHISTPADKSRFARCHLGESRNSQEFIENIERPADELLTPEFSSRMIGRMLLRASDYRPILSMMVEALTKNGMERRLADVYGTFACGAFMLLRDGIPETSADAQAFIMEEFDAIADLNDFSSEVSDDKDHDRVFQGVKSHDVFFESRNMGKTSMMIGSLLQVAAGTLDDATDIVMAPDEAMKLLINHGIRLSVNEKPVGDDQVPTHVLIHKNAPKMRKLLEDTPYGNAYGDVMLQAQGVKTGTAVRFGALGASRTIVVPIKYFS